MGPARSKRADGSKIERLLGGKPFLVESRVAGTLAARVLGLPAEIETEGCRDRMGGAGRTSASQWRATQHRGVVSGATGRSQRPGGIVNRQEAFNRIIASLHDAALGDSHWRAASALIDNACELVGSHLCILDRGTMLFDQMFSRGERRPDLRGGLPQELLRPRRARSPGARTSRRPDGYAHMTCTLRPSRGPLRRTTNY